MVYKVTDVAGATVGIKGEELKTICPGSRFGKVGALKKKKLVWQAKWLKMW